MLGEERGREGGWEGGKEGALRDCNDQCRSSPGPRASDAYGLYCGLWLPHTHFLPLVRTIPPWFVSYLYVHSSFSHAVRILE